MEEKEARCGVWGWVLEYGSCARIFLVISQNFDTSRHAVFSQLPPILFTPGLVVNSSAGFLNGIFPKFSPTPNPRNPVGGGEEGQPTPKFAWLEWKERCILPLGRNEAEWEENFSKGVSSPVTSVRRSERVAGNTSSAFWADRSVGQPPSKLHPAQPDKVAMSELGLKVEFPLGV